MNYQVEIKRRAIKDLKSLTKLQASRIIGRIQLLEEDLKGDVKKLTNFTPEYRLRVGDYRILFEIEKNKIIVYRVIHRSKAYY